MLTVRWLDEALLEAEDTARYYAEIDLDLGADLWSQIRKQMTLRVRGHRRTPSAPKARLLEAAPRQSASLTVAVGWQHS